MKALGGGKRSGAAALSRGQPSQRRGFQVGVAGDLSKFKAGGDDDGAVARDFDFDAAAAEGYYQKKNDDFEYFPSSTKAGGGGSKMSKGDRKRANAKKVRPFNTSD